MNYYLIIPAFIAGFLTFLAPCTLPLVPGYLGFISGVSLEDVENDDKLKKHWKIFFNGVAFVIGFSLVFIILGSSVAFVGGSLVQYRSWLSRIAGIFVILSGLFTMGILQIPVLNQEKHIKIPAIFKKGNLFGSLMLGSAFAFGWSPCVGPILGSILTLATVSSTVGQGALLLSVFSLGLAVPFLGVALAIDWAHKHLRKIAKYLHVISFISGVFIIFIGILLVTDTMNLWISYAYQWLHFINYDRLINYL